MSSSEGYVGIKHFLACLRIFILLSFLIDGLAGHRVQYFFPSNFSRPLVYWQTSLLMRSWITLIFAPF